jgi:hypothetical protein
MKTTLKTSGGKIDLSKALAELQKTNQNVVVPAAAPETDAAQVAALEAGIAGALAEKEETKQKKEKPCASQSVNSWPSGQGRQPVKIIAKDLSPTLKTMYFRSETRRKEIPLEQQQQIVMDSVKDGTFAAKMADQSWKFETLAPSLMTGEELAATTPDHVVYVKMGDYLAKVAELARAEWEEHYGKAEIENPLVG